MKFKKNIKLFSVIAIVTPSTILAITSSNTNDKYFNPLDRYLKQDNLGNLKEGEEEGVVNDADFFAPSDDAFTVDELENLANPPADPNVWTAKYATRDFNDVFAKQWYNDALQEGWRDINQYQLYLQVVYEKYAKADTINQFGNHPQIEPETNWIAWHKSAGAHIGENYLDGRGSPVRPTWDNTASVAWNKIDDSIPWYYYEGSDVYQFIFDENNIDNAWKRLEYEGRLVKVSGAEIQQEASDDETVVRNKYMVDGQIVDELPYGVNYYYVSSEKESGNFVRDDNGWKVIVTDQDKKGALTNIINPSDFTSKVMFANLFDRKVGSEDVPQKLINYPKDYNVNSNYSLDTRSSLTNKYRQFEGKYSIVVKADSYSDLVASPFTVFCYQASKTGSYYSRFGFSISGNHLFSGSWQYGQYAWMWVEDGHGGYKIWKNLENIPKQVMQWRKDHATELDEGDANDFIFYGTINRVFPKKDWLLDEPSFLNYNGF